MQPLLSLGMSGAGLVVIEATAVSRPGVEQLGLQNPRVTFASCISRAEFDIVPQSRRLWSVLHVTRPHIRRWVSWSIDRLKLQSCHSDCNVDTGFAFQRKGLQRDAIRASADQHLRATAETKAGVGLDAPVGTLQAV